MDILSELNINPVELTTEQRNRLEAMQADIKRNKRLREGNKAKAMNMREQLKSCQAKHQLGNGG